MSKATFAIASTNAKEDMKMQYKIINGAVYYDGNMVLENIGIEINDNETMAITDMLTIMMRETHHFITVPCCGVSFR